MTNGPPQKRAVLLDKNSGAKKLRDTCRDEGDVDCFLLPHVIRDANDDEVLEFAIRHRRLTVTFDRPMFLANIDVLAGRSPGVLLLRMDDGSNKRITRKEATRLLKGFKEEFPQWKDVAWNNSVVELTPTLIFLFHTITNELAQKGWWHRTDSGWQHFLEQSLQENASGINRSNFWK